MRRLPFITVCLASLVPPSVALAATMSVDVRRLEKHDEPVLWEMLRLAAHEPSIEAVKSQTCLTPYATNWDCQPGDLGVGAMIEHDETIVGAAWLRLWRSDCKGFSYIDETTPELAMAVAPAFRSRGIGRTLLSKLMDEAKKEGWKGICLSVRSDNAAAIGLYERMGFVKIDGSEEKNRVGGVSFKMQCRF